MYKSKHNIGKRSGAIGWFSIFLVVNIIFGCIYLLNDTSPPHVLSADGNDSSTNIVNKLQNGSFEEGQTWTDKYKTQNQDNVPSWNTTASDKIIELFRENKNVYIPGVTLKPSDKLYAAELNANEESTLYQNVKTDPSSVYEWGLDHGARNGTDTMALIIGPGQDVDPSKPSKTGRDQFMQMVDWLIEQGKTSVKTEAGLGEHLTVYSKKFGNSGTFKDNDDNSAFSLTPSTKYTEEWQIWIMASSKVTNGTNPWNSYGSNAEGNMGDTGLDMDEYYLYTVPAGQTETLFGFVSVGYVNSTTSADKAKTYGNFIDGINFQIYHPLSCSTTTHGSAVVGASDGTTGGEGSSEGHQVTIDNKFATYVMDGKPMTIQAVVKKKDADDGCEFVGIHYTRQDEDGNPVTEFLPLAGNELEYSEDLTDAQKAGKWVKSTNTDGDIIYTYCLTNMTTATDLHFVFIKSPTITYDANGGKAYKVEREYNTNELENVYSFKPIIADGGAPSATNTTFIPYYVSQAAQGQNDGWKFMGWQLTGDTVANVPEGMQIGEGSPLLPAVHTIACDYSFSGVNGDSKAQYFKIYDDNVALTKTTINKAGDSGEVERVTWTNDDATIKYANVHKGITMVAQWRWRQAIIPQVYNTTVMQYADSVEGGTVEITSVTDQSNENYDGEFNNEGGKAYFAETNEKVAVKATPKEGYKFAGWYDEYGNYITSNDEYSFTQGKESVKNYYARFSKSVTQTYVRQIGNGDDWEDTMDDKVGKLSSYESIGVAGEEVGSTATAGAGYRFIGWYDSGGNEVTTGATISYTTTADATYYARFSKLITQTYVRQIGNGDNWVNTTNDTVGTLSSYESSGVAGESVSSTATVREGYIFIGWYDSEGNIVSDDMLSDDKATISYTTTADATYYARFSKKEVTQIFIRQIGNGDDWKDTTDDKVGTLSFYTFTGNVLSDVSSTATAGAGYKFIGWYDSNGNKVSDSMLTNNGTTISYKTMGDATYYARFSKLITQTYVRQVRNGGGWTNADDTVGTLTTDSHVGVAGESVSSTATVGEGYIFIGWYDSEGNIVSDDMLSEDKATISYTTTGNATYYARYEKIYTLNVFKIDGDSSTAENKVPLPGAQFTLYKGDSNGDKTIVYKGESINCSVVKTVTTALNTEETKAIAAFGEILSPDKVYYLAETKAPAGYRLLDEPLKIAFDNSGGFILNDDNGLSKEIINNDVNVELANYLTLHMPVSGTPFTGAMFTAVGLSLLALAVICLFCTKIYKFKRNRL